MARNSIPDSANLPSNSLNEDTQDDELPDTDGDEQRKPPVNMGPSRPRLLTPRPWESQQKRARQGNRVLSSLIGGLFQIRSEITFKAKDASNRVVGW
jgi:hypothetical protein